MRVPWLLLLVVLPVSVHGGGSRIDQRRLKQELAYLAPHETITLTPRQIEEVETIGTLTLDPGQWRGLRAKGVHCPKRFDTVVDITSDALGSGGDIGEFAVALTPTTVAIFRDEPGGEEEGMRLFRRTVEDTAAKGWKGTLALQVDRRGQFYSQSFLVPFQTLLDTIKSSKPVMDDPGYNPRITIRLPPGLKRDSDTVMSRLDTLGEVAKQAKWDAFISDESPASESGDLTKH